MNKYYLIYKYHDTFFKEFFSFEYMYDYLNNLKEEYKNDSDFKFTIIYGYEVDLTLYNI